MIILSQRHYTDSPKQTLLTHPCPPKSGHSRTCCCEIFTSKRFQRSYILGLYLILQISTDKSTIRKNCLNLEMVDEYISFLLPENMPEAKTLGPEADRWQENTKTLLCRKGEDHTVYSPKFLSLVLFLNVSI